MKKSNAAAGLRGNADKSRDHVYTIEFKRKVARERLFGNSSMAELAERHALPQSLIKTWQAQYEAGKLDEQSSNGLAHAPIDSNVGAAGLIRCDVYTDEFKREVVRQYFTGQYSIRSLRERYRITPRTIYRWIKKYGPALIAEREAADDEPTGAMKHIPHSRYSIDFKRQVCRETLSGEFRGVVARRYNISTKLLSLWLKQCKAREFGNLKRLKVGRRGHLKLKRTCRRYSLAFKHQMARESLMGPLSDDRLAAKYNVSAKLFADWRRQYESGELTQRLAARERRIAKLQRRLAKRARRTGLAVVTTALPDAAAVTSAPGSQLPLKTSPRSGRRKFSVQFKRQIAHEYVAGISFMRDLVEQHQLSSGLIHTWVAK